MPKSNKHKKARVADFAKAKLKLGKGKQVANNATNTDISSKTIALPNQTIASSLTTKSEPVSRRNHTLTELLTQTRHYSIPVRKEALQEIQALLFLHPQLLQQYLLPLISSISQLLSDPSQSIRAQIRQLLIHIFDHLDSDQLVGISKGLILFTLSSLSSLDQDIKIDALKILDLLIERIPFELVRDWESTTSVEELEMEQNGLEDKGMGSKVVEALLGVLRVRNPGLKKAQGTFTSAATSDLSPVSRLAVLSTLSHFLEAALAPVASTSTSTSTPWYLASSFSTTRAYESFISSFPPSSSTSVFINDLHEGEEFHSIEPFNLTFSTLNADLTLDSLGVLLPSSSTTTNPAKMTSSQAQSPAHSLLTILYPTLLSSFLDSAPSAFSPTIETTSSSSSSDLETILSVISISKSLYSSINTTSRPSEIEKSLIGLLNHSATYFPFGSDQVRKRNGEEERELMRLNLQFSSLVSLLVLNTHLTNYINDNNNHRGFKSRSGAKKSENRKRKEEVISNRLEKIIENVEEWVKQALKGELKTRDLPLGYQLNLTSYEDLLPTIWALLNRDDDRSNREGEGELWQAVLDHFDRLKSGNEVKGRSFEFIASLILLQANPSYTSSFTINPSTEINQFLLSLPKYLWELGTKNPRTSESILEFLRTIVAGHGIEIFDELTIKALATSLQPFFHLPHPKRGSIFGPYLKLDPVVRKRAQGLVRYLQDDKLQLEFDRCNEILGKETEGGPV